ncbi:hypothetical protein AgCh_011442 [Apium graveolens]
MGNCQAIDNASIAIQHPSGRVDKLYSSVPASQIIKLNPSHYVALLLTTTTTTAVSTTGGPLRITRIKLLRPTDTLLLGHTYRLISAQEVMKELLAKKHAKIQKKQSEELKSGKNEKPSLDFECQKITKQQVIKTDRHRPRKCSSTNPATARSRGWHPSLNSISESSS